MTQFWYPRDGADGSGGRRAASRGLPYFDQDAGPIKGIATERQTEADGRCGASRLVPISITGIQQNSPAKGFTYCAWRNSPRWKRAALTLRERGISSAVMTQVKPALVVRELGHGAWTYQFKCEGNRGCGRDPQMHEDRLLAIVAALFRLRARGKIRAQHGSTWTSRASRVPDAGTLFTVWAACSGCVLNLAVPGPAVTATAGPATGDQLTRSRTGG